MNVHRLTASMSARLFCLVLSWVLLTPPTLFTPVRVVAAPTTKRGTPRAVASQTTNSVGQRDGELLVRFRPEASNEDKTAALRSTGGRRRTLSGGSGLERLSFGLETNLESVAATLRSSPSVEFVEPNYLIKADEVIPDDAQFAEQWALRNAADNGGQRGSDIGTARAWDATTGSEKTVIAVIDSGIDFKHPDLKSNQWTNLVERRNNKDDDGNGLTDDTHGWDWVTQSNGIEDESGHGTAVAGIIAAEGNNKTGISGVMWHAGLMSLRVLDGTGTGDVALAVEAIDYAVAHGAHVINCSWGTEHKSGALAEAVERAGKRGVMIIASAGNNGSNIDAAPHYPASYNYPHVVSVSSTDKFDQLTSWSNWGALRATIAAPGVEILSTKTGGGYEKVNGSSASAALVTGVVGLIKTLRPRLKAGSVRAMLIKGARVNPSLDGKVSTGGILNAGVSTVAVNSLAPNEGNEESSDGESGDSTKGSNASVSQQAGANNSAHNRRRVTPLFEVSNLPDLNQLRRVQSRAPRAAKPIPSTLRRHRPVHRNGGTNRSPNGDSGTIAMHPAATDAGGGEIIAAKYHSQPRQVLIAANHSAERGTFVLPFFKTFEGKSVLSTSDAPDNIAWSYSALEESDDSNLNPAQQQGGKSISNLIARLGSFNNMLTNGMLQASSPNDAAFISQTVPVEVVAGQPYTVTVKMQNTGSTTWTPGESYFLGSQNSENNSTWGFGRVVLPGAVAPNQEVVFTFQVTAPATPAVYHFQWRMLRENVTWFGQYTPDTLVIVSSNAAYVTQTVPTVMQAGQTYPVSVTMTNTGPATWTSQELYSLGARNPQDNGIWGANSGRTNLPAPVAPNQTVTFNFNVTAPATPGSYNFQRQMVKDGLSWFGAMTPNVAVNVTSGGTFTPTPAGNVIISEFRFRGGGGSSDEFVELYNNTNAPITVGTEDGSEGWSLVAFNPNGGSVSTVFTVPAATLIPARGHFLAVGQAYSLNGYAEADLAYTSTEIPDNAGIALFRTATPANFILANRLDAVGFNNLTNNLFYEGTGLTPINAGNGQYSFYRNLGGGTPQDTGSNSTDFMFVSTTGAAYGRTGAAGDQVSGPSVLGAPGPENLSSPVNRNGVISASVLDPQQGSASSPNRVYGSIPNPYGTGTLSTMTLRRRFTNNTGAPVTRLRFRLVDMTTLNSQVFYTSQADLRAMSSSDVQVTLTDGTVVPVQGTTLEEPPTQASHGGGLNTTLKAGTITTSAPLAAGTSVDLQLQLGVLRGGSFRFLFNVEALPQSSPGIPEPPTAQDFAVARLDPANRTGESGIDLRSGNYNWSLPLVSLPGRAGLDLGLALTYNSRVWTKSGSSIMFDADHGTPSPGFRLGFPVIQPRYFNSQIQKNAYLMVTPSGARVELRQTAAAASVYESADSSYLQLTESGTSLVLRPTDGSQMIFIWQNGEYQCVEVKDRNGNYLTVAYDALGQLQTVRDTLAREINFVYDSNQNLNKITQVRAGVEHVWASFGWGQQTIQTNFAGLSVVGLENGSTIPVLMQVGLADGSLYRFDYTTWGQVNRISRYTPTSDAPPATPLFPADYTIRAYSAYFLRFDNASDIDSPRVQARSDWAEHWNGGAEANAFFGYDPGGAWGQATAPDGTRYVEEFGTDWRKGLTVGTKIYEPGDQATPVKTTSSTWKQDDENLQYESNPRIIATNIDDKNGNHRHTEIDYTSYGLPSEVREFSGATVLRRTLTTYNLGMPYVDVLNNRRLIGIVTEQTMLGLDPADNTEKLYSKETFEYDADGEFRVEQGTATQHDAAYNAAFNVRGNVTTVRRWDVSQSNISVASSTGYNTNGSVIFSRDPLWASGNNRQVTISYTDAFVDGADQPSSFNPFAPDTANTFAYPTTITDAEDYKAFSKYDYQLGRIRQVQSPPANTISTTDSSGPINTTSYDAAGRPTRVTNSINAAQTLLVYPASLTAALTKTKFKVEQTTEEQFTRSFQIFDGAGRVRASSSDFEPGRQIYSAQKMVYDKLGRLVNQSNPTAITGSWVPADEDATAGWVYSAQVYDWKGRPTLTVNADGTTKEAQYGGCGCAGGAVVLTRDEIGRRQKVVSDILGRAWKSQTLSVQPKSEALNGGTDADVYRTATNTYNARDQITRVLAQPGTSGTGQETLMTYDGYGRLSTRKTPIQTSPTIYAYNPDDTMQNVTDARGSIQTMIYNKRRLVTRVSYELPSGTSPTSLPPTGPTTFAYDAAGNRLWMNDDSGHVDYQYDALSRLSSETRQFAGRQGSYPLNYSYNLAGQVAGITDPAGVAVNYGYDQTGRLSQVTGSPYAGVSQYATGMQYRAFGALKSLSYGNNLTLAQGFDTRQRLTSFQAGPQLSAAFQYYDDGQIRYAKDNTTPTMDRAYDYDHAGRLSQGLSGGEARDFVGGTQGSDADGIYRHTYQYDVWDNLTGKTPNRFWSRDNSFTDTYANQRKQGVTYDDEGNITQDGYGLDGRTHTYDAAGRKVETSERSQSRDPSILTLELNTGASPGSDMGGGATQPRSPEGGYYTTTTLTISQGYDGDGGSTKRVETKVSHTPFYLDMTTERTDYYVRSSVLGGRVITELNEAGQKVKTKVYAGNEIIAEQDAYFDGTQGLTWKQRNPVTGTQVEQNTLNEYTQKKEYDPFGLELGESDPYWNNAEPDYATFAGGSFYRSGGNPFDDREGCTVDFMAASCSQARALLGAGLAEQCLNNDCGPHVLTVTTIDQNGQETGSASIIRVQGQTGWNGSLDGTYRRDEILRPGIPSVQFGWRIFNRASGGPQSSGRLYRAVEAKDINVPESSAAFDDIKEAAIKAILEITNSQACSDAFVAEGWRKPYDSVLGASSFRLAPAAVLQKYKYETGKLSNLLNATSPQLDQAREALFPSTYAVSGIGSINGAGFTILNSSGNSYTLTMLLDVSGINSGSYGSIKDVLIHEFVHAAYVQGSDQGAGKPYGDLNYIRDKVGRVLKACQ